MCVLWLKTCAWNGSEKWLGFEHTVAQHIPSTWHTLGRTRAKVSSSADILVFSSWASQAYSGACRLSGLRELPASPPPTRRHYFSPAWSRSGWLILLSPCSVIQIWKVNNKLTSLRLYTGVTHSSGYRTHGSMRARHISHWKSHSSNGSQFLLRRQCSTCFELRSHDVRKKKKSFFFNASI